MPLDTAGCIARLARPKLLARAARAGMALYRRERDLPGLIKGANSGAGLITALIAAEEACEEARRAMAPGYSPARHVRVLSALLAEGRAA
ncbi:MAG: DUF6477 family protein [Rubrimonas sp.]|uniref:DUF6477 family protein n=1 Tax=Rubrimonas sp. TaxID=2036015 RepID=UPI002FDCAFD8